MKARNTNSSKESREILLREYFLNASLIALLNRVGAETSRLRQQKEMRLEGQIPPATLG